MGWRGVTRSLVAASRAAERDRVKRANAIERAQRQVDRVADNLDSELARDLDKVARAEQKLTSKPVTLGGASYQPADDQWSLKRLADETGKLTWSAQITFKSDATSSGTVAADRGRTYELIAVAITRWCVLAAFRVSSTGDARPTRLLNKTNPTANKVFLISDGSSQQAMDGDLDAQIAIDSSTIAVVAFPSPSGEPSELSIEFQFRDGASRISLPSLAPQTFAKARTAPTLVDIVRSKLTEATTETRSEIAATRAKLEERSSSSGSWAWVVLVLIVLVLIGALSSSR